MRADPDGPGIIEPTIRIVMARMTAVEFSELRPMSTRTPAWLDELAELGEADTLPVTRPDEP